MTIVALLLAGLAVFLVATLFAFAGLLRSLVRQHARERDLLLNQMMNLAGKPWQPAPAEVVEPVPEPEDDGRYVLTPESLPDY